MQIIHYVLLYLIIHILSVIHLFNVFKSEGYEHEDFDIYSVWLFAPILIFITTVIMILRFIGRKLK